MGVNIIGSCFIGIFVQNLKKIGKNNDLKSSAIHRLLISLESPLIMCSGDQDHLMVLGMNLSCFR